MIALSGRLASWRNGGPRSLGLGPRQRFWTTGCAPCRTETGPVLGPTAPGGTTDKRSLAARRCIPRTTRSRCGHQSSSHSPPRSFEEHFGNDSFAAKDLRVTFVLFAFGQHKLILSNNQWCMFLGIAPVLRNEYKTSSGTDAEGNLDAVELKTSQDTKAIEAPPFFLKRREPLATQYSDLLARSSRHKPAADKQQQMSSTHHSMRNECERTAGSELQRVHPAAEPPRLRIHVSFCTGTSLSVRLCPSRLFNSLEIVELTFSCHADQFTRWLNHSLPW